MVLQWLCRLYEPNVTCMLSIPVIKQGDCYAYMEGGIGRAELCAACVAGGLIEHASQQVTYTD